jgi:hypothetical protein
VARQVAVLLSFVLLLLTTPDLGVQGHVAVVSLTVVVLLATVLALRGRDIRLVFSQVGSARGAIDDEQCLRGSFRRLISPGTPGRLGRPRAPGHGHRLA